MGAWENKKFGNDAALDFVADIEEKGKSEILKAIKYVVNASEDEFEEEPKCEEALAAIEYIAAAKGNPSADFPEEATAWLKNNDILNFTGTGFMGLISKKVDIISLSIKAIQRIKNKSELRDLWAESDEFEDWMKDIEDLEKRVS